MYRIRFHGRGGQGIKTASRILGSALFAEGFEVQDAPRYGAERRGAPIDAFVRADRDPVAERGPIDHADLVIVADETLVQVPAAGVMAGLEERSVLVIASAEEPETWRERLGVAATVIVLDPEMTGGPLEAGLVGALCVGAAARMVGVVGLPALEQAARDELQGLPDEVVERNLTCLREGFAAVAEHEGCVREGARLTLGSAKPPAWIELDLEPTELSAPDIHGAATSEAVETGLWRTMRPEIDESLCRRCSWICSTFCPDAAIDVTADRLPVVDYDHCKGCLLCAAVCPTHAIRVEPEERAVEVRPRETGEQVPEAPSRSRS